MKKRVFALLLAAALVIGLLPLPSSAEGAPTITASTTSTYPGNWTQVYIDAQNLENLASLELEVYYDSDVLEYQSNYTGELLGGTFYSINTDTPGVAKLTMASVEGVSGDGRLFTLSFSVKNPCVAGEYPVRVIVGEAYDVALAGVSINAVNGKVIVQESYQSNQSFYLDSYWNNYENNAKKGDTLTLRVNNSWWQSLAAADFSVAYDHELLKVKDVTIGYALSGEGAVCSVNTDTAGLVKISYATNQQRSDYELFQVEFEVVGDIDGTTSVTSSVNEAYNAELYAYAPHSVTNTLYLEKLPAPVDYPDLWIGTENVSFAAGQETETYLYLENGANVAAGDFQIDYDPAKFQCVSVTAAEEATDQGAMIVVNTNANTGFHDGSINFSYINADGTLEEDTPIVKIVWKLLGTQDSHDVAVLSGRGVTDSQYQSVTLEYVPFTCCICTAVVTPSTCVTEGYTTYTCTVCGKSYQADFQPTGDHTRIPHEGKAATCEDPGWKPYDTCKYCDYTTYEAIPKLGHNFGSWYISLEPKCGVAGEQRRDCLNDCGKYERKPIEALKHDVTEYPGKEPTCTEPGWKPYEVCGKCGNSTYEEIPALDHDRISHEAKEPTCLEYGWFAYDTCSRCEYTTYEVRPALDHALTQHEAKAPTCKEVGWNAYEDCSRCDYTTYEELPVTDHVCQDWTITKQPTCKETGTAVLACIYCGNEERSLELGKTDHAYESVVTEPTASSQGYTTHTCTACGDSYVDSYTDPVAAEAVIGSVSYASVEEALEDAASGQRVTLVTNADATGKTLFIKSGVTLDLGAYTLKADGLIGLSGSTITGATREDAASGAKLYVDRTNIVLSEIAPDGTSGWKVIPVWNGDHYVFARAMIYNPKFSKNTAANSAKVEFIPTFNSFVKQNLFNDGCDDNDVSIIITVVYMEGDIKVTREYFYTTPMVVASMLQSRSMFAEMTGCNQLTGLQFQISIVTEAGPVVSSAIYKY